jgi:hypothetical protein
MIGNVENVIKWLQVNDLNYWRVKVKEGDNATVFETTEGKTFDDNVSNFRRVMDLSQGNRYFITANSLKAQSKGNYFEEFKNLETQTSAIGSTQQQVSVGVAPEEVDRRVADAVERAMDKLEMKRIKEENAELQKIVREADNTMSRIMKKVEPYIGTVVGSLVGKFIPQAPQLGIAGIEDIDQVEDETVQTMRASSQNEPEMQNQQARLQTALEKWSKADPDFIDIIETVSNMAATGNPMYQTAKGLLKSF